VSGCSDDYVQVVAAQQDPGDGHVQIHVYELTERDGYVTIHRVGEAEPAGALQRLALNRRERE